MHLLVSKLYISSLVQILACRLIHAKPLSEPMLDYCPLDPKEQISLKLELKFLHFHSRKCLKMSGKWQSFCLSCKILNV